MLVKKRRLDKLPLFIALTGSLVLGISSPSTKPAWSQDVVAKPVSASQEKLNKEVADVVGESTGIPLKKEDLQPREVKNKSEVKKKGGFSLNPMRWFYGPITEMQETIARLEQQIIHLEAPIAGLEKPLLALRGDVNGVDKRIKRVRRDMGSIRDTLVETSKSMDDAKKEIRETKKAVTITNEELVETKEEVVSASHNINLTRKQLGGMHATIVKMGDKLNKLDQTVEELKKPVEKLPEPVVGVESHLARLENDLSLLRASVDRTSNLILTIIILTAVGVGLGTPLIILVLFKLKSPKTIESKEYRDPESEVSYYSSLKPHAYFDGGRGYHNN